MPWDLFTNPAAFCEGDDDACNSQALAAPADFRRNRRAFCDDSDPACNDASAAAVASSSARPAKNLRIRETLLANDGIQSMLGTGTESEDYWIQIDEYSQPLHGSDGGTATIIFARPTSYEGDIIRGSQPCAPYSSEGYVEPGHPCQTEEREFEAAIGRFIDVFVIYVGVDPEPGHVFNWFTVDVSRNSLDRQIVQIEATNAIATAEAAAKSRTPVLR